MDRPFGSALVAVLVVLLAGCTPTAGEPSASAAGDPTLGTMPAASGDTAAQPTPVPTDRPEASAPGTWTATTVLPDVGSAMPAALVAVPDGYLAVGGLECVDPASVGPAGGAAGAAARLASTRTPSPWSTPEPPARCFGGIWVSADGRAWTDLTLALAVAVGSDSWPVGMPDPGLGDAAAVGNRVVITGRDAHGTMVWWGDLAGGFHEVANRDVFSDAVIAAVAAGPSGFIAVGTDMHGQRPRGAVWTSADGADWTRVPDAPAFDVGVFTPVGMEGERIAGGIRAIAAGGPGLVAVGATCGDGGGCSAAGWWSADGITWSRGIVDAAAGGLSSVAVGSAGIVAVGGTEVLVSADGTTWSAHALPAGVNQFDRVAAGSGGFLALRATRPDGASVPIPALWSSGDGASWRPVTAFPRFDSSHGLIRGSDLVATPTVVAVWWDEGGAYAVTGPPDP